MTIRRRFKLSDEEVEDLLYCVRYVISDNKNHIANAAWKERRLKLMHKLEKEVSKRQRKRKHD